MLVGQAGKESVDRCGRQIAQPIILYQLADAIQDKPACGLSLGQDLERHQVPAQMYGPGHEAFRALTSPAPEEGGRKVETS